MIRTLSFAIITAFIAACSQSVQSPTERLTQDYIDRLSNALNVEPFAQVSSRHRFPTPRELKVPSTGATISVREFLSMRQCDLHSAIASKNSLLGKFALPSQSLFIDLEIVHLAPACIKALKDDQQAALAELLEAAFEQKKKQLPLALFTAILGDTENAKFWSPQRGPSDYPANTDQRLNAAIETLAEMVEDILSGKTGFTGETQSKFEASLFVLQQGDGGILLQRFNELQLGLQQANSLIEQRLEQPLCLNGQATPSAKHFQNVVNSFFIQQVQREAVALVQRYQQLLPRYLKIEQPLIKFAPVSYQNWAQQRQQLLQQGMNAAKRHVSKIQEIYSQCGLRAG